MSGQIQIDRATKGATAPAKCWKNKWFVPIAAEYLDGEVVRTGVHWGKVAYPSKEVAEHKARLILAENESLSAAFPSPEWLGAFPVST